MKREQFSAGLRKYCRKNCLAFRVAGERGKASHVTVYVGDRFTVVQSGELKPFHVMRALKQLGLPPDALN
jgi:hypothetical protein